MPGQFFFFIKTYEKQQDKPAKSVRKKNFTVYTICQPASTCYLALHKYLPPCELFPLCHHSLQAETEMEFFLFKRHNKKVFCTKKTPKKHTVAYLQII